MSPRRAPAVAAPAEAPGLFYGGEPGLAARLEPEYQWPEWERELRTGFLRRSSVATMYDADWGFHGRGDPLGQRAAFDNRTGTTVLAAGRRWGKSELGVKRMAYGCQDDALRGIAGVSWVVAPIHRLLRPLWRKFMELTPRGWITGTRGTEGAPDAIEFGPARLEFLSADNPLTLVAEGLRRLWVDECGIVREAAWNESLQPALLDFGAPALLTGTPKGRNWFYRQYVLGLDPEVPGVRTFGGSTYQNPYLNLERVAQLADTMPERKYRQEVLAEFLSDEGAVFRGVRACVGLQSTARTEVLGVDLAKTQDFTVLFGLDAGARWTYFDRFNKLPWPVQKRRVADAARRLGAGRPCRLVVDSTGVGDPIVDDLKATGLEVEGFKFTGPSKEQLVDGLAAGVEERGLTLPDEPVLLNELEAFEFTTTRAGNVQYAAPEGLYDDCVMAVALAWRGVRAPAATRGGASVTI